MARPARTTAIRFLDDVLEKLPFKAEVIQTDNGAKFGSRDRSRVRKRPPKAEREALLGLRDVLQGDRETAEVCPGLHQDLRPGVEPSLATKGSNRRLLGGHLDVRQQ